MRRAYYGTVVRPCRSRGRARPHRRRASESIPLLLGKVGPPRARRTRAVPTVSDAAAPLDVDVKPRLVGTVLVVDDEAGVRASIRAILEGTCEVVEAESGAEALEVLRTHAVDVLM